MTGITITETTKKLLKEHGIQEEDYLKAMMIYETMHNEFARQIHEDEINYRLQRINSLFNISSYFA